MTKPNFPIVSLPSLDIVGFATDLNTILTPILNQGRFSFRPKNRHLTAAKIIRKIAAVGNAKSTSNYDTIPSPFISEYMNEKSIEITISPTFQIS